MTTSAPITPPAPSALLGAAVGPYFITRVIGAGGMGTVYEAQDAAGGRAAVKVLLPQYSDDPRALLRFENEARAISAVQHPGLVRLLDCGQLADGTAYILMELLEGESLAQRLARLRSAGQRLPLAELCLIGAGIAETLAAAHARGIVHRDLKPENVFLCPDPAQPGAVHAKLLDFGIAKFLAGDENHQTTVGLILGTPTYMAPEQCEGSEHLTDRVDVYALGVMLYELCTSRPPFTAETGQTVMRQHIFRPPPPLPEEVAAPAPLAALIGDMLAKEPERRPPMTAVAQRLVTLDRTAAPASRAARRPAKRRRLAVAAGAAGLLIGGGAALIAALAPPPSRPLPQPPAPRPVAPMALPATAPPPIIPKPVVQAPAITSAPPRTPRGRRTPADQPRHAAQPAASTPPAVPARPPANPGDDTPLFR